MDAPGRHNVSYSALQKGALGLAICVRFSNFFAYEMRRVGGHIHEDYSILLERDIEIRHKIDMVCGNTKGNENCTYTFVVGRSTSKLYGKSSAQNETAKAKKYQRDDISKQLSRAFWKS